jgi:hypothetical protein
MISNLYNLNDGPSQDKTDIWQSISELCKSHKLLFDLFNIQQERIIHLETVLGTSAILPKSMQ